MMKTALQIQDVIAEPGTTARGFLSVAGTSVTMPIVIVNGSHEGPTLLVTAGVHGGEYPSIEAGIRFGRELEASQVSGTIIVMSPVSLNAFHARQAFLVPEDGKNLNRVFPGKATGSVAERMAFTIMNDVVPHISAWIDMHGGDIPEALIPFAGTVLTGNADLDKKARSMAEAFGLQYLLHPSHLPGTTISAAASLGIPALLVEAGQLGILDELNTDILLNGCWNVAGSMGMLAGKVTPVQVHELMNWPWVRAAHVGCWYPKVNIGDRVSMGQVVGVVKDYFGEVIAEYTAPSGGLVLLVCAAMSVNMNDPLVGIAY
ncbi:MAG: succinylglutamate desuccinylase/aspartoacylase family protein [Anaerolineae bacterium]